MAEPTDAAAGSVAARAADRAAPAQAAGRAARKPLALCRDRPRRDRGGRALPAQPQLTLDSRVQTLDARMVEVVQGARELSSPLAASVVTLGAFDGVHRGH